MHTDIAPHLHALRNAVDAAGVNYDVWWVYKSKDTRPEYLDTMNQYLGFFSASIHAHFVAMVVALYRLYETRPDTFNVPRLLQLIEAEKRLGSSELTSAKAKVAAAKPIWIKVCALRNEAFGHRSNALSIDEIFRKASISGNELKELIETSKALLKELGLELEGVDYAFNLSATAATLDMLKDLKAKSAP